VAITKRTSSKLYRIVHKFKHLCIGENRTTSKSPLFSVTVLSLSLPVENKNTHPTRGPMDYKHTNVASLSESPCRVKDFSFVRHFVDKYRRTATSGRHKRVANELFRIPESILHCARLAALHTRQGQRKKLFGRVSPNNQLFRRRNVIFRCLLHIPHEPERTGSVQFSSEKHKLHVI